METKAIENPIHSADKYQQIDIETLIPHPRNYKKHPDDQIKHLCESINENGIFRPIVIAEDNTILAGHGVVLACKKLNVLPSKNICYIGDSLSDIFASINADLTPIGVTWGNSGSKLHDKNDVKIVDNINSLENYLDRHYGIK